MNRFDTNEHMKTRIAWLYYVEGKTQDEIVALSECGDDTEVRHIAGGEHDRSFAAREIGERAFKRIVLGIVPTDEM